MAGDGIGVGLQLLAPGPERRASSGLQLWRASEGLPAWRPDLSSKTGLSAAQKRTMAACLPAMAVPALFQPALALSLAHAALFGAAALLIAWRAVLVAMPRPVPPAAAPGPRVWPVYTVLAPLYREPESARALAAALSALDYPPGRLDIKFILEADDQATADALDAAPLPLNAEIVVAPPGAPRTKPRALNYALGFARGDFVAIYDAEDHPRPDQLKTAAAAFAAAGPKLACLQAPLAAHNGDQSWIAGQWALEYAVQFGRLLPAAAAMGAPLLLGGTSNHFRRAALDEVGGWDAWNVTEDADLGVRLARFGWRAGVIDPPTEEEAPERLSVWLAQRSRWIKGFLQTWIVLMRRPRRAVRELGWAGFLAVQFTLGGAVFSAFAHGPLFLWLLGCLLLPGLSVSGAGLGLLAAGYLVNIVAAAGAPARLGRRRLALILSLPLYWPLQTLAALRAAIELIRAPHAWAKTPHGFTLRRASRAA